MVLLLCCHMVCHAVCVVIFRKYMKLMNFLVICDGRTFWVKVEMLLHLKNKTLEDMVSTSSKKQSTLAVHSKNKRINIVIHCS